jgi:ABC-2 type transport system permease protein
MVTNTVGLGMSFLGGIFVPREILGESVLNVSRFLPTYWYVNAVDAIQNVGSNHSLMRDIQISIGIEAIFAIAIFAVALVATRARSEARAQIN